MMLRCLIMGGSPKSQKANDPMDIQWVQPADVVLTRHGFVVTQHIIAALLVLQAYCSMHATSCHPAKHRFPPKKVATRLFPA
jgi:hypothetical protein